MLLYREAGEGAYQSLAFKVDLEEQQCSVIGGTE